MHDTDPGLGLVTAGNPIPDADHVARGIRPREFDRGEIQSTAFQPGPKDKGKLSTDWVECAYANPTCQNVKGSLARLRRSLILRPQSVAILKAHSIRGIRWDDRKLDAIEDPDPPDLPCHSAIIGMKDDEGDLGLQQALADLANAGQVAILR